MNAMSPIILSDDVQSRDEASRFVSMLDPAASQFHFRVLGKKNSNPRIKQRANYFGSLDDMWPELAERNAQGDGVYVVVNEGGQRAEDISLIRAVFVDVDDANPACAEQIRHFCNESGFHPHCVVESSPGRLHLYWLCNGVSVDEFGSLQKQLAKLPGCDGAVFDLSRVMRLPGTLHTKGNPWRCRIVHSAGEQAPHGAEAVRAAAKAAAAYAGSVAMPAAALPPSLPVLAQPYSGVPEVPRPSATKLPVPFSPAAIVQQQDRQAMADAASSLHFLDATNTQTWLLAKSALKGFDEAGWQLLDGWSRLASNYDAFNNRRLWDCATPLVGGLAPLFAAAAAAGWRNPASVTQQAQQQPNPFAAPAGVVA